MRDAHLWALQRYRLVALDLHQHPGQQADHLRQVGVRPV